MIEIWAGGQTGVDLGAHLEALDLGMPIGGFMPADGRNEDGPIPEHVALHLRRHDRTNPAARTRANVANVDAALVIVQDRRRAGATRGTALTIRLCEMQYDEHELLVVDSRWSASTVEHWVESLLEAWRMPRPLAPLKLLIAGPRASLWPEGEQEARRFARAIWEATQ